MLSFSVNPGSTSIKSWALKGKCVRSNKPVYTQKIIGILYIIQLIKSKGVPRQAEVALGVPGRLRPQIISTFGTTRVVGHQP
jgi:hypothetical protein